MPLIIGTTNIGDIYKGTTKIDSVYKGTTLVYTSGTWEEYLYELIYYSLVPTTINSKVVKNRARVNTIYGNSVVENQLVLNGNFENTSNWVSLSSVSNNVGTTTSTTSYGTFYQSKTYKTNHKYLVLGQITSSENKTIKFGTSRSGGLGQVASYTITANVWLQMSYLFTAASNDVNVAVFNYQSGTSVYQVKNFMCIDLTLMFGTGNEPTAITDIRVQALLNRGYVPYNTGTLKSVDIGAISSEPYNLFDGEFESGDIDSSTGVETSDSRFERSKNYIEVIGGVQYSLEQEGTIASWQYAQRKICQFDINFNFICSNTGYNNASQFLNPYNLTLQNNCHYIRMVYYKTGEGTWNNVCFHRTGTRTGYAPHTNPQTLLFKYQGSGVGTAHDTLEITSSAYVFTKNMNSVDLSTISFTYQSANTCWYSNSIQNLVNKPTSNDNLANILSTKYTVKSFTSANSSLDGLAIATSGTIFVYTTDNINSPSGTLAYQLATPQVISIPKKHLGIVDLGSLNWNNGSYTDVIATTSAYTPAKKPASNSTQANIYCGKYITKYYYSGGTGVVSTSDSICISRSGYVYINDSNLYNKTNAEIQAALSGTYLFYETDAEVADIPVSLGVESGGTLTTNSYVLPNLLMEIKCK